MDPISMIGAFLITFSLIGFGYGINLLQRFKRVKKGVLWFLSIGILLDVSAIICMISGSRNSLFSLHGLLGYLAALLMFIDLVLVWRFYRKRGTGIQIDKSLYWYSRIAYGYWVAVYIVGLLLVILK